MSSTSATNLPAWLNPAVIDPALRDRGEALVARMRALAPTMLELAVDVLTYLNRVEGAAEDAPDAVKDVVGELLGSEAVFEHAAIFGDLFSTEVLGKIDVDVVLRSRRTLAEYGDGPAEQAPEVTP